MSGSAVLAKSRQRERPRCGEIALGLQNGDVGCGAAVAFRCEGMVSKHLDSDTGDPTWDLAEVQAGQGQGGGPNSSITGLPLGKKCIVNQ